MHPSTRRRLALAGGAAATLALTGCSALTASGPTEAEQGSSLAPVTVSQTFCANVNNPSALPFSAGGGITLNEADGPEAPGGGGPAPEDPAGTGCPTFDTTLTRDGPEAYSEPGTYRVLAAIAVPDGSPDPTPHLQKQADATFEVEPAAASRAGTPPEGTHWVGYRSSPISYAVGQEDAGDVLAAAVRPARTAEGTPTGADVPALVSIGAQVEKDGLGGTYAADRPVDCGEAEPATGTDGGIGGMGGIGGIGSVPPEALDVEPTVCPPARTTTSPTQPPVESPASTPTPATDAVVQAPGAASVTAGRTATLEFDVVQGGRRDGDALALGASTTAPGATATPGTTTAAWPAPVVPDPDVPPTGTTTQVGPPSDEIPTDDAVRATRAVDPAVTTTAVPVRVAVPAATRAGSYDVVLTAKDAAGVTRSGTARLRVAAAPAPATAPADPTTPADTTTAAAAATPPATDAAPTRAIAAKVLRRATVSRRTRRVHLGSLRCAQATGSCRVRAVVRVGRRTVASRRFTVAAGKRSGVTLRLSRAAFRRLERRAARATLTITGSGETVVRRTTLVAKKRG